MMWRKRSGKRLAKQSLASSRATVGVLEGRIMQQTLSRWIVATGLALAACSSSEHGGTTSVAEAQSKTQTPAPKLDANGAPGAHLLAAYVDVQVALAKDDALRARTAFKRVQETLTASALADESLRTRAQKAAKQGESDKDLPSARLAFRDLSDAMLAWLSAEPNPASAPVHLAFCPMAFDTGAKWLQASDTLQNPYYGSEMLTCGRIESTIKPGEKLKAK
jgi:hypothetical protein